MSVICQSVVRHFVQIYTLVFLFVNYYINHLYNNKIINNKCEFLSIVYIVMGGNLIYILINYIILLLYMAKNKNKKILVYLLSGCLWKILCIFKCLMYISVQSTNLLNISITL